MIIDYTTYMHNHLPYEHGISPDDLFIGTQIPCHKLKYIHAWGCPIYILDHNLQKGKKLPRWRSKARQVISLGFGAHCSNDVHLVLNISTSHISPSVSYYFL